MEKWYERKEELEEIAHNNRLQDIEDQRTEEKAQFDEQIANLNTLITQDELRQKELQAHIEDTLRIRQEAIDLIEGRSQDFYNRLIAWNKEYGTGVDNDIRGAWDRAYAALEKFAGPDGLIHVQSTLEYLAGQSNELADQIAEANENAKKLSSSIGGASDRMGGLVGNSNKLSDLLSKGLDVELRVVGGTPKFAQQSVAKYHEGTKFVKKKRTPYDKAFGIKDNETMAILKVGEAVLPVQDNYFNGASDQQAYLDRNTFDNLTKLKSNGARDINTDNSNTSISIGDIVITGNADMNTVRALKNERENLVKEVFSRIQSHNQRSGYRNMKLHYI